MIHEIYPHQYQNAYLPRSPVPGDCLLIYGEGHILLAGEPDELRVPRIGGDVGAPGRLLYLFTLDDAAYYLAEPGDVETAALTAMDLASVRTFRPQWQGFAIATGAQLWRWYRNRQFCGHCGGHMVHSETERAMYCPACDLTEYPKISPAVIVGIIDGDKLLMTKYAGRAYTRYALVAGFLEIGECFEDTVRREVMEEVGLEVKNIRYYKSQPWAFTDCLLAGYYCDLAGDGAITLDTDELAEAQWVRRADIRPRPGDISLTGEMIERFRLGEVGS